MNTACDVIRPDYMRITANMPPTRACSVCGANELGYTGSYYIKPEFWLCPECIKRLKKLMDKENKE